MHADIPRIEVHVVEENDGHIGPLGTKGIGEVGITGVAAAIANAVHHASGVRVRDLPITLDKVLGAPMRAREFATCRPVSSGAPSRLHAASIRTAATAFCKPCCGSIPRDC